MYLILIFVVQHKGRSQVFVKMAFPFNKESFMNDDVRKALSEGFVERCTYVKEFMESIAQAGEFTGNFTEEMRESLKGVRDCVQALEEVQITDKDMVSGGGDSHSGKKITNLKYTDLDNKYLGSVHQPTNEDDSKSFGAVGEGGRSRHSCGRANDGGTSRDTRVFDRGSVKDKLRSGYGGDDSSSSDESYTSASRSRRSRGKANKVAIGAADYRMAPKMEKFKEGGNIKQFFKMFEEYCRNNVRGSRRFWLGALEEQLEGKVLEIFHDLRDEDDEYEDTKEKLIQWYEDTEEVRRKGHKKKFKNAQRREGDSLYIFSIRLESMFKRAYPGHDVHKSSKLFDRFKKAISRKARGALESQVMNAKMKGEQIDWRFVQRWAQLQDTMKDASSGSDVGSDDTRQVRQTKKININLSQGGEISDRSYVRRHRSQSTSKGSGSVNTHCYACGQQGHYAKECNWGEERRCYNCGDTQHIARECTTFRQPRDRRRHSGNGNSHKMNQEYDRGGYRARGEGNNQRGKGFLRGRGEYWRQGRSHSREVWGQQPADRGSQYYGVPNQYPGGAYSYQPGGYAYNPSPRGAYNPYAAPFIPQQGDYSVQQVQGDCNTHNSGKVSGANTSRPLN